MSERVTLGLVVGNRGFFPDHLCRTGRKTLLKVLRQEGISAVALSEKDTKFGTVETWQDARKCADLFRANRDRLDGILITLPNFGDERAAADTVRLSGLDVPVLVHAWPDEVPAMGLANRRDSFCGKISLCNNLNQYGIRFTLTDRHTVDPESSCFQENLRSFTAVCRVVRGMRNLKMGAIGARPAAFKTVRYSEKVLEKHGISVDTIDLSEVFSAMGRMRDDDPQVRSQVSALARYLPSADVPRASLLKMAKLKTFFDRWSRENDMKALALQCWTSLEETLGIVPCAVMSCLSNSLIPTACEVDITGALGMYILQTASGTPSAIVDWNNNYGDESDKAVFFHCSNLPAHFFDRARISYQDIIAGSVGKENAYGSVVGRMKTGDFTYLRLTTDETSGTIRGYTGEGRLTDDPLDTFGGYGVFEIPRLQELLRLVCREGFEHHTVINLSRTSAVVKEALVNYRGWNIRVHL